MRWLVVLIGPACGLACWLLFKLFYKSPTPPSEQTKGSNNPTESPIVAAIYVAQSNIITAIYGAMVVEIGVLGLLIGVGIALQLGNS